MFGLFGNGVFGSSKKRGGEEVPYLFDERDVFARSNTRSLARFGAYRGTFPRQLNTPRRRDPCRKSCVFLWVTGP